MAQKDSRRLSIVTGYLYPDLNKKIHPDGSVSYQLDPELQDFQLRNDGNGQGTYIIWQRDDIPEPTEQELADAKEPAVNAAWWKGLRFNRDRLLKASDWSQGTDIPSALKDSYATYREELRDLPTAVSKPSFETLNNQSVNKWHEDIGNLMPTKPTE